MSQGRRGHRARGKRGKRGTGGHVVDLAASISARASISEAVLDAPSPPGSIRYSMIVLGRDPSDLQPLVAAVTLHEAGVSRLRVTDEGGERYRLGFTVQGYIAPDWLNQTASTHRLRIVDLSMSDTSKATVSDTAGISDHVRIAVTREGATMNATHTEVEVQAQARRLNHVSQVCPLCYGRLTFTVPDANSPDGRLTRPCSQCNQHGRVWYRSDLAPAPGRPRVIVPPLTDEELMARS